jgi:hypothetical protein
MAINYGNYAQAYGGRQDLSGLGDAIGKFVKGNQDAQKMKIQNEMGKIEDGLSQSFSDAAYTDVADYDTIFSARFEKNPDGTDNFSKPIKSFMNAGDAYQEFKKRADGALTSSQKIMAENMGLFNPIQFKQQYEQMKQSYMPMIERKLQQYQADKGFSSREMQSFINSNSKMRNFLRNSLDTTSPMYGLTEEHTPRGILPGFLGALTDDPLRPAAIGTIGRGATEAIRQGYGAYKGTGTMKPANIARSMNPLNILPFREQTVQAIKSQKGSMLKVINELAKKNNLLFGRGLEKGWQRDTKTNLNKYYDDALSNDKNLSKGKASAKDTWRKSVQKITKEMKSTQKTKLQTRADYKKGLKKFTDSYKVSKTGGAPASTILKKSTIARAYNLGEGKKLFDATKAGTKAQVALKKKNALESAKKMYDSSIKKAVNIHSADNKTIKKGFNAVDSKLKSKIGKGSQKSIQKYIKKYGTKNFITMVASRVGPKQAAIMAARLAAGGAVTAFTGGWGAAIGAGINAYTLYDIGKMAYEALGETGGVRRPDKVLFGGK